MRAESGTLLVCAALSGCAVSLGSGDAPSTALGPAVPALAACLPLSDRIDALDGRLGALTLPDGTALFTAESASVDGVVAPLGFQQGDAASCLSGTTPLPARPLVDVSAFTATFGDSLVARPLAAVTTDTAHLFFALVRDGLTNEGFGVAHWDGANAHFVADALLWTSDRPSYGSAALVDGDFVYVFGGLAARFLAADAYVARVPVGSVSHPAAYEYWAGGGAYSPNADEAAPLVEAGTSPSVVYDAGHGRFLLAYTTPLATDISVRSGLGVTGPWSLPVTLGRCDLPVADPGSFCGDVTLVPALAAPGGLALTQPVATFARVSGALATDYWTRVLTASWPEALP